MRNTTLWAAVLGVDNTVVEDVEYDEELDRIIASVRPRRASIGRCGICLTRSPWYDRGARRRRWRALDLGTVEVWLESEAPRVNCTTHGPTVRHLPWARHNVGHTHAFDDQVAWLATHCSKTAITQLMRIAWRSVGSIISRVWADIEKVHDRFAGLRRIGIDEISYKRGHRYLTVVVDHDSGRLVWAAPGRDRATLNQFFDALEASGEGRCNQITHVSADGAEWISHVVEARCPQAVRCADPFHVVKWATTALDMVRREEWNNARGRRRDTHQKFKTPRSTSDAQTLQRSRYVLWKNPNKLTEKQHAKLAWIQKSSPRLHRAYLLKEGLRLVFQLDPTEAPNALEAWISWARRCRIPAFVELQHKIVKHKASILAAIEHGLSNGRIESVNTKIRLITRIAFGFKSPQALIALAMLNLGGHRPQLPRR